MTSKTETRPAETRQREATIPALGLFGRPTRPAPSPRDKGEHKHVPAAA